MRQNKTVFIIYYISDTKYYIINGSTLLIYGYCSISFFSYGASSVPVKYNSLRQCRVAWRKHGD